MLRVMGGKEHPEICLLIALQRDRLARFADKVVTL